MHAVRLALGVVFCAIEVLTASSDSVLLEDAAVGGTASPLHPIALVVATIGAAGEVTLALGSIEPTPGVIRPGFDGTTFLGNDDGSTGRVPLGFDVNFFGTTYGSLYV